MPGRYHSHLIERGLPDASVNLALAAQRKLTSDAAAHGGLEFRDVAQREGRRTIVNFVGKHGRVRTVPMPSWAKTALDAWASVAGYARKAGRYSSRSRSALAMPPSRPPSATWGSGRTSTMRLVIGWDGRDGRDRGARQGREGVRGNEESVYEGLLVDAVVAPLNGDGCTKNTKPRVRPYGGTEKARGANP